ncbi:hypothetical protein RRG08_034365 [Elysia crispata]|uniref:Uncharacterized protein n=1 Tax=Elysia crispata TaxID=231223 RepID=A0AAE0YCW9_9GAST|nr:hypothetical protein RRG08_034365 [Elysia crispata]
MEDNKLVIISTVPGHSQEEWIMSSHGIMKPWRRAGAAEIKQGGGGAGSELARSRAPWHCTNLLQLTGFQHSAPRTAGRLACCYCCCTCSSPDQARSKPSCLQVCHTQTARLGAWDSHHTSWKPGKSVS